MAKTHNPARRAFDTVALARTANSLTELEASAGAELRKYGFDVVIAVESTRNGGVQGVNPVFGDAAAPSIQHYLGAGHPPRCPVIQAASSVPTQWRELRRQPLASKARRVFDELGEFSMHHGHVLAVHLPNRLPIAVSLAGPAPDLDCPDSQMAVHLLSLNYGLIGARLTAGEREGPRLSDRQLEALKWVREGKSSWDIGRIMGISARTVDEYILCACRRLGVRTRLQAVIEAAHHKLFEL